MRILTNSKTVEDLFPITDTTLMTSRELLTGHFHPDDYGSIVADIDPTESEGMHCVRFIREAGTTKIPIIGITGQVVTYDIETEFLENGGVYLLQKDILDRRMLLARIKAVCRGVRFVPPKVLLADGSLVIDRYECSVTYKGEPIHLTQAELRILVHLADHQGEIQKRKQIISTYNDLNQIPIKTRTVAVHISRLRRKLRDLDPALAEIIGNIYGSGYFLRTSVAKQ